MLIQEETDHGCVVEAVEALLLQSLRRILQWSNEDVKLLRVVPRLMVKIMGNQSSETIHPLLYHRFLNIREGHSKYREDL